MLSAQELIIMDYLDTFKMADERSLLEDLSVIQELKDILFKLRDSGLINRTDEGLWEITKTGETAVEKARKMLLEQCTRKEEFLNYCKEFEVINNRFKSLISKWQVKEVNGRLIPNVHDDPEYDFSILEQLNKVHEETKDLISRIANIFPIYERFIKRLDVTWERINNGNFEYIDVARNSYHNIWFELHESLLKLSGMKRIE